MQMLTAAPHTAGHAAPGSQLALGSLQTAVQVKPSGQVPALVQAS
jgi:hypothetical protein